MVQPIRRTVVSPSGTTVSADGDQIVLERQPGHRNLPPPSGNAEIAGFRAAVDKGHWKDAHQRMKALVAKLDADPNSIPQDAQAELSQILNVVALKAGEEKNWSFWEVFLAILTLGIYYFVKRGDKKAAAELEKVAKDLKAKMGIHGATMGITEDGDISGHMNLYAGNGLLGTTSKLAQAFGGPFVGMSDAVATQHYGKSSTMKPADFERSAGVLLIDRKTRQLVSQDGSQLYTMKLDDKSVFKGADGKLYFEPKAGETATEVPAADAARIERTDLNVGQVGARARLPNDPEARPDMRYVWHGYSSGEVKIGWWGQCESSGMLGSMGLMPSTSAVTLYDEKKGKEVKLSANEITDMMVFMGRENYFQLGPAVVAGNINRAEERLDSDKPHTFHEFVMAQIEAGLPFNLEEHSYEQIWNYPVFRASIQAQGDKKRVAGGGYSQTYIMQLDKSGGGTQTYTYDMTYDARGKVVDSTWDIEACEAANGKDHAVPDKMKSYFSPSTTRVTLKARGAGFWENNRWTDEAVRMVGDLYFASHADAGSEGRVYAVRTKDGKLLQMSQAEYDAYKVRAARANAA